MTEISNAQIEALLDALKTHIVKAMAKHGNTPFLNGHEIIGGLTEEFDEFKQAAHKYKHDASHTNYHNCVDELMDIATQAVFAAASVIANRNARQKTQLG